MGPSRPRGWTGHPEPGWKEAGFTRGMTGGSVLCGGCGPPPGSDRQYRGPVLRAGLLARRLLSPTHCLGPEFSAWGRANACVDCWRKRNRLKVARRRAVVQKTTVSQIPASAQTRAGISRGRVCHAEAPLASLILFFRPAASAPLWASSVRSWPALSITYWRERGDLAGTPFIASVLRRGKLLLFRSVFQQVYVESSHWGIMLCLYLCVTFAYGHHGVSPFLLGHYAPTLFC